MSLCFPGVHPKFDFWYRLANKKKPTQLRGLGGFCVSRSRYSDSLTHTLAGLQQQQQRIEVVLGVIVIASNLLYRG
jgi:hypothetical protein